MSFFNGGPWSWWRRNRHDIDNFLVTYPRLMWLKRWLQFIFENEEHLQDQTSQLGNAVIKGKDTPSVDLTIVDEPLKQEITFDPISETEEIKYTKENPVIQADVKLSSSTEKVTVGTASVQETREVGNATTIKEDGVFTPDLHPFLEKVYDQVEGTVESEPRTASFNELTSFALSMTGLNYHTFFEKETGVYFAYSGTVTHSGEGATLTGNVLTVYDKTGNLLSFITLKALSGHVIGNILNLFVSYAKKTGEYFIEIGCENEVAYAFKIDKTKVYSNSLNVDKNVSVTEFNSIESFNTIIGSENTAIPVDAEPMDNWYKQIVTVWNTESNSFLYGPRSAFYDDEFLTKFEPDDSVKITTTTQIIGVSADYNGNMVAVYNSQEGQTLDFFALSREENTVKEILKHSILFPTKGGAGSTISTYTKKLGALETLDSNSNAAKLYGVQILNQPKDSSDSDKEWTILVNHVQPGINDSTTNYVSGLGNSSRSLFYQLLNSEGVGIGDLLTIANNFNSQLAGISMFGEYNIARTKLYGFDLQAMTDTPDKQTGLVLGDYGAAVQFQLKNSRVALNRFTQELSWDKRSTSGGGVFDDTVTVKAIRRVILAIPYQGAPQAGKIGEWTVQDMALVNSRDLNVIDTASIDLTKSGSWPNGDATESIKADVNISKASETINLPHAGGTATVSNGSKIKSDGLWSPDYAQALQHIDNNLQNVTKGLQEIVNNLYNSGAINSNDIDNFKFNTGRNIATGNINLFSNQADGSSFIRTNKNSTENDLFAG